MPKTYAEQRKRQQQIDNLDAEIKELLGNLQDNNSDLYQQPILQLKYLHDDNKDRRERELSDHDLNSQKNKFELIKLNCEIIKLFELAKQANDQNLIVTLSEAIRVNDDYIRGPTVKPPFLPQSLCREILLPMPC